MTTVVPNLFTAMDREEKGIPIGRAAECTLRNQHAQYIFTWYVVAICGDTTNIDVHDLQVLLSICDIDHAMDGSEEEARSKREAGPTQ